ncbi:hypothetical protein KUTeg_018732 [Tegillarca granosa]|uniref:Transcriptional coactivator p15 (PC4) C-terminal domain-containing protein n=1 Tax=Tegillarca granosa TaxID=220873 RepID=A0ABQ9EGL1_TEGGR|nr:hypothetical protein KUTeg_018732 [Tegillarca granosa]
MNTWTPVDFEKEIPKVGPMKKSRKKIRFNILEKVKKNLNNDVANTDENASDSFDNKLVINNANDKIEDDAITDNCSEVVKTFKNNVEICRVHLGDERYLVVKPFAGKIQVHLRLYQVGFRGSYPTKKGVALNLEMWKKLEERYIEDIDYAIKNFDNKEEEINTRIHLGRPFARVDVRRWFMPADDHEIVPTQKGVSLTFKQWDYVKNAMQLVRQLLGEELDKVTFCEDSNDHQNQLGYLRCSNCNPNYFTAY